MSLEDELARFEAEISSLPQGHDGGPSSHGMVMGPGFGSGTHAPPQHPVYAQQVQNHNHNSGNHNQGKQHQGYMPGPSGQYNQPHFQQYDNQQYNSQQYNQQYNGQQYNSQQYNQQYNGQQFGGSGMGMGMGHIAPPPAMGATVSAPALTHPMMPEPQAVPHGALSVAQIKALEKEKKAAKEALGKKNHGTLMHAAGKRWRDASLDEWPDNDHRIFCGDLGNEVTDDTLAKAFNKYSSFAKAKVVRDHRTNKSKGFGFISFLDSADFAKALKEMQGKYIGNRPCKLSKSSWDERVANVKGNKGKAGQQQQQGGGKKQKKN